MSAPQAWTSTPITAELVRGAVELEETERGTLPHRLPAWARAQCDDPQLAMVEAQPSGVRLAFSTRATAVELDALATRHLHAGAPARPAGVYDLLVDGELAERASAPGGDTVTVDVATGRVDHRRGAAGTVRFTGLPDRLKDVELWLPHHERTHLVALRTDAPLEPAARDGRRVWLHHGSSISQGSNAASPSTTWPALAARRAGVDLVNLGLGGGALLDPFTARTMRESPADLVSVKIGINLVNADLMRRRALAPAVHGFLDTVREGHPHAPLLVVSPLLCPLHEDTPGPSAFDAEALARGQVRFRATGDPAERAAGKLTLDVIREELAAVVAQRASTDANIHLLDGRELYGPADAEALPLPDGLHPDAETHRLVAQRFADAVFAGTGPFATRDA